MAPMWASIETRKLPLHDWNSRITGCMTLYREILKPLYEVMNDFFLFNPVELLHSNFWDVAIESGQEESFHVILRTNRANQQSVEWVEATPLWVPTNNWWWWWWCHCLRRCEIRTWNDRHADIKCPCHYMLAMIVAWNLVGKELYHIPVSMIAPSLASSLRKQDMTGYSSKSPHWLKTWSPFRLFSMLKSSSSSCSCDVEPVEGEFG